MDRLARLWLANVIIRPMMAQTTANPTSTSAGCSTTPAVLRMITEPIPIIAKLYSATTAFTKARAAEARIPATM